jgi:CRP-like cAMP-binding protein
MFEPLFNHIARFVKLSVVEQGLLAQHLSVKRIAKKEYLLKAGDVCHANYFIAKGCFRMYFIKENGQEQIVAFGIDDWWTTDYTSMEMHKPSLYYIQAIEDSEVIVLTKTQRELLFEKVPLMERYFRQLLQRVYAASIMRMKYLFEQSAEERYHGMNNAFPEFVQRVPQYMLASYLGITPEVLSKIRAKK